VTVDKKGKELLREADFDKFRRAIVEDLVRTIASEGRYGSDIKPIIEETLKEEAFAKFAKKLRGRLEQKAHMGGRVCDGAACRLVEEEVANDIKSILPGQIDEEVVEPPRGEKEAYLKGRESGLWRGTSSRLFLGRKAAVIRDLITLFKEHRVVLYIILAGMGLLFISASLFGSIYKALVVGLTLTIFPSEGSRMKIANVLGGLGGILIFFTSFTMIMQYILLSSRRNEQIRELARRYLEKKGKSL